MIAKKYLLVVVLVIIILIFAVYFGIINLPSLEIISHGDGMGSSPPNHSL